MTRSRVQKCVTQGCFYTATWKGHIANKLEYCNRVRCMAGISVGKKVLGTNERASSSLEPAYENPCGSFGTGDQGKVSDSQLKSPLFQTYC
jgi:hypothetical protein